jgi:hypothetical protein
MLQVVKTPLLPAWAVNIVVLVFGIISKQTDEEMLAMAGNLCG